MSAETIGNPFREDRDSIFLKLAKHILKIVPVIAVTILIIGMTQAFEDDFSTNKEGWVSLPPTSIARDASQNNVHWQVSRSSDQRMYHALTSDFKMGVDAVIDGSSNNCQIDIGLVRDINNLSNNNLFLRIGYYGGGTPYQHWYACVVARYDDGTSFTSATGEVTPVHDTWAGFIPINKGQWYSYELEKTGSTWNLKVYDRNTTSLENSLNGTFTGEFLPFNYVYFGNSDTSDWPSADGRIDNIKITSGNDLPISQNETQRVTIGIPAMIFFDIPSQSMKAG